MAIEGKTFLDLMTPYFLVDLVLNLWFSTFRENVKVIDDDALNRIDDNPFDDFEDAEDAPMIAGYYDERPAEVKLLENYRNTNRWQPMPGAEKG